MSYLLDSDTFIAVIRGVPLAAHRFTTEAGNLYLSTVSILEVESWLLQFRTPLRYRHGFFALLRSLTFLDVTEPIAHRAAIVNNTLRGQKRRLGFADLLIAATAIEQGLTLAIYASQQFTNIPGLTAIDWSTP